MTYLDHIGLVAHLPDLCHVPELLLYECCLKSHQHEECEDTVVPVGVETPQADTEHLKSRLPLVSVIKVNKKCQIQTLYSSAHYRYVCILMQLLNIKNVFSVQTIKNTVPIHHICLPPFP